MRVLAVLLAMVMPGLGQVLNKQYIKALVIFLAEHVINTLANVNAALYLDLNGQHHQALEIVNFQYALFYPGVLVIGTWDAYANAKSDVNKNAAYYFLVAGFMGTIAIIFSTHIPFPTVSAGALMIVIILFGAFIYRM